MKPAGFAFVFSLLVICQLSAQDSRSATPASQIRLAEGFEVELLYSVPISEQGSWVSLTAEKNGRLIASDQSGQLYRITPPGKTGAPEETEIEKIDLEIGQAQGLLYAFDSLYVVVNGNKKGLPGAGLYRVQDTNNDDEYDKVTLLRKFEGGGEHGPHAVILSPDGKSLYICAGNHTMIPDPETSRVPRNWQEDQLLPSMPDAGGHATTIRAPGGWIAKTDPEGKSFELIATGFRNEYDIAFNQAGELFTYDADMEWDVGLPWYRPTRVCHVTSGAEFGWRTGTGKWPASYPDSLPSVVDIGPGSPTGICFGTGAAFPTKYQDALLIADWSYGIIYAVHLEKDGATYSGETERLCSAPALQVTDMAVNPNDGMLYFAIGGRGTQSGLYRIRYEGNESTKAPAQSDISKLAALRQSIEQDHKSVGLEAVERNWKFLNHKDRFIRFAARIAIEHQDVELWRDKATSETDPIRSIHAIIALARNGSDQDHSPAVECLARIDLETLSENETIDLARAFGLVMLRLGIPLDETKSIVSEKFAGRYPNRSTQLNMEFARLLIAAEDPSATKKTVDLLVEAPTQEEQIHYALCLRVAKKGWTPELRNSYFNWFLTSASLQGGNSFGGFLENIRNEAISNIPPAERASMKELLAKKPETDDPYANLKAMPFVKKWTVDDLIDDVEELDVAKRDLKNGKKMFSVGQCFKCHRFEGLGGIVGPDLTAAGRRFNSRSLLESLIEPNKVVSDQYQATVFELDNGKTVVGRVANLSGDNYRVQEDMLRPGKFTNVNTKQIEDMYPSEVSMMPGSLIDNFTRDQILDMIAYIKSATVDMETGEATINASDELTVKKKLNAETIATGDDEKSSPNVVLIISDDQSWTDYGFMNHDAIQTPNLDRLAKESYTFTRGYVPTALCRPSLVTIISGLYAHQHKISGNDPAMVDAAGKRIAEPEYSALRAKLISHIDAVPTLPRMLAEKGYVSHQSGKWWEGNFSRGGFTHGMTRGFPEKGGRHGDDGLKIGREGIKPITEFIDAAGDKPFFIWYAPFLPHTPHNPPAEILEKYKKDGRPIELAKYYAMCDWFDQTCGELLNYLDEKKLSENTIVVYVTDNGWIQRTSETKTPGKWSHGFAPMSKQSPNEGGTRTPIMIRWPGRISPKLDKTTLVSSIDIAPTILEACGLKPTPDMRGISLLGQTRGEQIKRNTIFGESFAHDIADVEDPSKSLIATWCIDGDWKIIRRENGRLGRYQNVLQHLQGNQLFNLANDPHESNDLAKSEPDRLNKMLDLLETFGQGVTAAK